MKYLVIACAVMMLSCGGNNKNHRYGNGFDQNGFDKDGFNSLGYNKDGFNIHGYNRDGYNIYGFNEFNFRKDGLSMYGHNIWGLSEDGILVEGVDHAGKTQIAEHAYSNLGIDQLGYYRMLPHGLEDRDERFHTRDGFNREELNYLGIKKDDFNKSYDAILDIPIVKNYPNDLGQLVNRFNQSCFQLELFSQKEYFLEKLDDKNFMEILYEYNNKNTEDKIGYFLKGLMRKENNIIIMPDNIINELISHLKKGIYFCEYFLFSGDLKPHTIKYSDLKLDKESPYIVDMEMGVDYDMWFKVMSSNQPLDYLKAIKEELIKDEILNKASYSDPADLGKNKQAKMADLDNFFIAYKNNYDILNPQQAKLYLYLLARKIAELTHASKIHIAELFLHGGAHCSDAKRLGVVTAFTHYAPDDYRMITNAQKRIFNENSLETSIKSRLLELKKDNLSEWINNTFKIRVESGSDLDWSSGFPAVWNVHSNKLGLNLLGNAHNLYYDLNFDRFFEKKSVNDNIKGIDATSKGNFTKDVIYYTLYPKNENYKETVESDDVKILVDIKKKIFGPLWDMIDNELASMIKINTHKCPNHPIMNALLLRLGILKR